VDDPYIRIVLFHGRPTLMVVHWAGGQTDGLKTPGGQMMNWGMVCGHLMDE
jgi:hypothetical protein